MAESLPTANDDDGEDDGEGGGSGGGEGNAELEAVAEEMREMRESATEHAAKREEQVLRLEQTLSQRKADSQALAQQVEQERAAAERLRRDRERLIEYVNSQDLLIASLSGATAGAHAILEHSRYVSAVLVRNEVAPRRPDDANNFLRTPYSPWLIVIALVIIAIILAINRHLERSLGTVPQ